MIKLDWIKKASDHLGITLGKARGLWDFFEAQTLAELQYPDGGGVILVPGVGKIKRVYRAPSSRRNPRTGDSVEVPAKIVVKLVPGRGIKEFLNPDLVKGDGVDGKEEES